MGTLLAFYVIGLVFFGAIFASATIMSSAHVGSEGHWKDLGRWAVATVGWPITVAVWIYRSL